MKKDWTQLTTEHRNLLVFLNWGAGVQKSSKYFSIWSTKIVQKFLGEVQFFNFHLGRHLYLNFYVQERPLFYLVLPLVSKGLSYDFYHMLFQSIVSLLALSPLKYQCIVAATKKAIFGAVSCLKINFVFPVRLKYW